MSNTTAGTYGQIIKALKPGTAKALVKLPQGGCVEARRISTGVMLYWRYTQDGKTDRVSIGPYDASAPPRSINPTEQGGYSVQAARVAAEKLAQAHALALSNGLSGLRDAQEQQQQAAQRAAEEAEARRGKTLRHLLTAYCDHLQSQGRRSHLDARSIFNLHVYAAWPAIARKPACDITSDDVIGMLRRLIKAGKGRTGNKLRAYLMAAYQVAVSARSLASIPEEFLAYRISINPVQGTRRDTSSDKADKNPLSQEQMRLYWGLIKDLPGLKGAALRLHLLTGGQRLDQLVKVKRASLRDDCITLVDAKGRPGKPPRQHLVPLVGMALTDAQTLAADGSGEWLLSTDHGKTHMAATTLAGWAKAVVGNQIEDFQAKRVRSGVETLLAASSVSREDRGHLQSHGVQGVQAAHYDAHDYLPEKKKALKKLQHQLERTNPQVVELHAAA